MTTTSSPTGDSEMTVALDVDEQILTEPTDRRSPPRWAAPGWARAANVAVVAIATLFVVWNLRPWVWFLDSTPTGGDLGAHVWAPAFLRDSLLPDLRLTGWTPDWYAGFPAFTFYMVIPSLFIVMVNVGLDVPVGVYALLAASLAGHEWARRARLDQNARLVAVAGGFGVGLVLRTLDGTTYDPPLMNTVTIPPGAVDVALGVIGLPIVVAAVVWAHTTDRPSPRMALAVGAAVVSVVLVPVPYGIAIKLVVVAGLVVLPVCAFLLGRLGGLASPGPALLAVSSLLFVFDRSFNIYGGNLMSTMAGEFAYSLGLAFAVLTLAVVARGMETGEGRVLAAALLALTGLTHLFSAFFALVGIFALVAVRFGRRSLTYLMVIGPLSAALSAWWVLPFLWNRSLLNDMGWGKEDRYLSALWSRSEFDYGFLTNDPPFQVFVVLAVVGAALSLWRRVDLGTVLAIVAAVFALMFVALPEGRLWNVRLLPFYYLAVYLLAAVGVAEMIRLVAATATRRGDESLDRSRQLLVGGGLTALAASAVIVMLGMPLRSLPGGEVNDGAYEWGPISTRQFNLGGFWTEYNFEGYEDKPPTEAGGGSAEYMDLVATMARVGEQYGCGRSLWEFGADRLNTYGTTMAPMLLPHWTNGCIGSMEGLYFEASSTTPFHFLAQSELSQSPSRAQRDLEYSPLDVAAGVDHLQLMGVRYYLAFSPEAVTQARAEPELTEVGASGAWVVFLVSDSDLVVGLDHLPVVYTDVGPGQDSWLEPAVEFWEESETRAFRALDGPDDWPRAPSTDDPSRIAVDPATVESVRRTDRSISFEVDRVGVPVLVRVSYFPNWTARGADGPYRVTPNLMVVVPTSTEVELVYARSPVELVSTGLTVAGLLVAVVLAAGWSPSLRARLRSRADEPVDPAAMVDATVSWERIAPSDPDLERPSET